MSMQNNHILKPYAYAAHAFNQGSHIHTHAVILLMYLYTLT